MTVQWIFLHRRSRIGSRLMREVESMVHARGAKSMWLGSNRTASAVEFYLKQGYKVISLNSNELVAHRLGDPVFAKELH